MIDELKELKIKNLPDTADRLVEIERINACKNIIVKRNWIRAK